MSSAGLKPGDRVRLTHGDSVLVGVMSTTRTVVVDGIDPPLRSPFVNGWQVEVLPPLEREWQPGDVAMDQEGVVWVRTLGGNCWKRGGCGNALHHEMPVRPLTWLVPA